MFTYKSSCLLQTYWHLRTKEKLYWADSSFETCGVINCGSGWISEGCCKPVLGVCCNPCKTKISSSSSRLVYFSLLFTVFLVRLSGPAFSGNQPVHVLNKTGWWPDVTQPFAVTEPLSEQTQLATSVSKLAHRHTHIPPGALRFSLLIENLKCRRVQ